MSAPATNPTAGSVRWFATTHWSVVLTAKQGDASGATVALEKLCRTYWYPLYAYIRRHGRSPHDAQDLTQAFFLRLLEGNLLERAAREKGRFRSFLLTSLKNFLSDEWDKAKAVKRGGGTPILSLDEQTAEDRYRFEPADEMSAEKLFDRRWAMTLLEKALQRLEQEYAAANKAAFFHHLHVVLLGEKTSLTYANVGAQLRMTEGAVKVAAHRMHHRYRELLRAEIASTVASPDDIDDELRQLFAALSG